MTLPEETPFDGSRAPLAYHDPRFLDSDEARPLRLLSEYLQPLHAFRRRRVHDTILRSAEAAAPGSPMPTNDEGVP